MKQSITYYQCKAYNRDPTFLLTKTFQDFPGPPKRFSRTVVAQQC